MITQLPDNPPFRLWFGDSFRECTTFGALVPFQVVGLLGVYPNTFDCRPSECECVDVYVEGENVTDELNNDKSSFLFDFPSASGDKYFIDKYIGTSWVNLGEFDNTTGIKYPIGYWAEYPFRGGVFIDWRLVRLLYGFGTYRLRLGNILPPPAPDIIMTSPCFNLMQWTCNAVDNTTVLEVFFRKTTGNILWNENPPTPSYFDCLQMTSLQGAGWYDRNRYKGSVGRSQHTSKKETTITYFTNFNNRYYDIASEKYLWQIAYLSEDQKRRLLSYGLNADKCLISDFKYLASGSPLSVFQKQFYRKLEIMLSEYSEVTYSFEGRVPLAEVSLRKRSDFRTTSS
jgi:hypothetical protein